MLGSNSSAGWGPKLHGGAIEPRLPFQPCAALDIQALNPRGFGGQSPPSISLLFVLPVNRRARRLAHADQHGFLVGSCLHRFFR